jgi:hypothetical protein
VLRQEVFVGRDQSPIMRIDQVTHDPRPFVDFAGVCGWSSRLATQKLLSTQGE